METISEEQIIDLCEVLLRNPREDWADILANHFKVNIGLVETICQAFFELDRETFNRVIHEVDYEARTRYPEFKNGQILEINDKDRELGKKIEENIFKSVTIAE